MPCKSNFPFPFKFKPVLYISELLFCMRQGFFSLVQISEITNMFIREFVGWIPVSAEFGKLFLREELKEQENRAQI